MSAVLQSPSQRLAHSREQLRLSLHQPPAAESPAGSSSTLNWLDELRANPGVSILVGVVSHWWSRHPLRVAATVAVGAATAAVKPIAQRHPWGLLAGAFVVGGLLAWSRPWRWTKPALLAGLLPQLLLAGFRISESQADRPRTL